MVEVLPGVLALKNRLGGGVELLLRQTLNEVDVIDSQRHTFFAALSGDAVDDVHPHLTVRDVSRKSHPLPDLVFTACPNLVCDSVNARRVLRLTEVGLDSQLPSALLVRNLGRALSVEVYTTVCRLRGVEVYRSKPRGRSVRIGCYRVKVRYWVRWELFRGCGYNLARVDH